MDNQPLYHYVISPSECCKGWKLRLLKDEEIMKGGGTFTPNGGGDEAMRLAKVAARETGRAFLYDHDPDFSL